MKKLVLLSAIALSGLAQAQTYTDYAPVLAAEPIYSQHVQRTCVDAPVTTITTPTAGGEIAGTVIGGVLGGLTGHALGGGSGKTVLTIGGAVGGALAGRAVADTPLSQTTVQQNCSDTTQAVITGYAVTYSYRGVTATTSLPYNPGSQLEMHVVAEPVTD